jgi:glycosyltransferase involved in cell wall biosynthesis
MLFSILIANYNNSRFLDTALASLQVQTCTDWEVILVDDASTDDFEKIIAGWRWDRRIRIFKNARNEGCGYTKRRCAELASGSLLAFLDPDDALTPGALAVMAEAHRQHPSCSLIHSTHYICDPELNVRRVADYPRALPPDTPYLLLSDGRVHHFATFRKASYRLTEGLSPLHRKAVDQDLYYKLEEVGKILFIDQPLYFYRIHAGSISNAGKERETSCAHYSIIMAACLRRMKNKEVKKIYRTRYYKVRIFRSFRERRYLDALYSLMIFPFAGGWSNLAGYLRKLPKEGFALVRRSLVEDYEIKV